MCVRYVLMEKAALAIFAEDQVLEMALSQTPFQETAPSHFNVPLDVRAYINYFSRDAIFKTQKPYTTSFPVDDIEGAAVSNHKFTAVEMLIQDVRGRDNPSLDTEGFTYFEAPTSLSPQDFDDKLKVQTAYFGELKNLLEFQFPRYRSFAFFDYEVFPQQIIHRYKPLTTWHDRQIRKRSHLFPRSKGAKVDHAQPLAQAHIDFSPHGAKIRPDLTLSGSERKLLGSPCDMLNVWRPLHGPNDDWPVAFCNYRTIDPINDVIPNDIVYENSVGEDDFLQVNTAHRWYYLSRHRADEVVVWRNTDIPGGGKPRAFHSAFENSRCPDGVKLRASIEVRVAAFL